MPIIFCGLSNFTAKVWKWKIYDRSDVFVWEMNTSVCGWSCERIYVPTTEWVGTYCFWCGSRLRRHPRCSLSALYLLNQWVDFDQTCTDPLLGGRKEGIRFWWPWPHFQCHTSTLKFSNFDQKMLACTLSLEPNDRFWAIFIYCNVGMV